MADIDCAKFVEKFNDIKELYRDVKAIIILAENIDKEKDTYVACLNELRNTLDHLIRSLEYPENLDSEFSEAKEHLYRAGYDAYEILAVNLGETVIFNVREFSPEVISNVFPHYYKEVKPVLLDLKVELADTRAHKKLNPDTGTKSFSIYQEKVDTLIKLTKLTEAAIPDLQNETIRLATIKADEKREKKSKTKIDTIRSVIIGIIITIVGELGFSFIYSSYKEKNITNSSKITSNKDTSNLKKDITIPTKKL